jgi:hypothetical protein
VAATACPAVVERAYVLAARVVVAEMALEAGGERARAAASARGAAAGAVCSAVAERAYALVAERAVADAVVARVFAAAWACDPAAVLVAVAAAAC